MTMGWNKRVNLIGRLVGFRQYLRIGMESGKGVLNSLLHHHKREFIHVFFCLHLLLYIY